MNRATYQADRAASSGRLFVRPEDLVDYGAKLAATTSTRVWLLRGPLGSGKSTFARGVIRSLGHRRAVPSPTFALKHMYRVRGRRWRWVAHIDAYRVRSRNEAAALDLLTLFANRQTLTLIEWPERLRLRPPVPTLRFRFAHAPGGRRVARSGP